MARVVVEDRAFNDPRLRILCHHTGWCKFLASGYLLWLWRETQEQLLEEISSEEIGIFFDISGDELSKVCTALCKSKYLSKKKNGNFLIKGNARRLSMVRSMKDQARAAATKRWSRKIVDNNKTCNNKKEISAMRDACEPDAKRNATAMRTQCVTHAKRNATAMLRIREEESKRVNIPFGERVVSNNHRDGGDSEQILNTPKKAKKTDPEMGKKTQEAIAAYCDAFKLRYDVNPMITRKDSGLVRNFVKDFGLEKTKSLLEAYLQMNDAWFCTKSHDIPTFATNITTISTNAKNGKRLSRDAMKKIEIYESNAAIAEACLEEMRGNQDEQQHATPF